MGGKKKSGAGAKAGDKGSATSEASPGPCACERTCSSRMSPRNAVEGGRAGARVLDALA